MEEPHYRSRIGRAWDSVKDVPWYIAGAAAGVGGAYSLFNALSSPALQDETFWYAGGAAMCIVLSVPLIKTGLAIRKRMHETPAEV
jgi:hypothetical protein